MEDVKKENKSRFSSLGKKSKFIIIATLIATIGTGIAGTYYYHQTVEEKKTDSFYLLEKNEYKGIAGLSYKVLQAKQSYECRCNQLSFVLDITLNDPIPSQTIPNFEKELFQRLKNNKISTRNIIIHVFNDTSHYQKAVEEGYKGGKGLIQTITIDRSGSKPIIRSTLYEEINKQQGDVDAVIYNVENSKENGKQATIEVVVSGNHDQVKQFVAPFAQLIKQLNPHLNDVTLKIYSSREDYNKQEPTWTYRDDLLIFEQTISN